LGEQASSVTLRCGGEPPSKSMPWRTGMADDPEGGAARPIVTGFHHVATGSVQYVVADPTTCRCAIIDPVLDFDPCSASTGTNSAQALLDHAGREGLTVEWILDTHPHADHFSAAAFLKQRTGAPMATGEKVVDIQKLWKGFYNFPDVPADGSQWDRLFADGERFRIGNLHAEVMFTPGHTLASVAFRVGDAAFIHDTLFVPDSGTARTDFPGGDAAELWRSIQKILALPEETRLFTGHDYRPGGREARWESTVAEQKRDNVHLRQCRSEAEFVAFRQARDRTLAMPRNILQALQVNIRGGRLPEPEANGRRYLKIPLDLFDNAKWEVG